jgi:hypothetical protein
VTFEGESATEAATTTTFTLNGTITSQFTFKTYFRPSGATDQLYFGWIADSNPTLDRVERLVYNPAALNTRTSLAVGETFNFVYPYNKTVTVNGVVQPAVSGSEIGSWTFAGIERITVPAGTFDTCRWGTLAPSTPSSVRYELVGHGLLVKTVVRFGGSTPDSVSEATVLLINGAVP